MDEKIIALLKQKDEYGIQLLKQQYHGLIYYILKGMRLSSEDIEEGCNDVYIKIWQSFDSYDHSKSTSLKNYIASITRNTGVDYIRKNKKLQLEIQYEQMDIFEKTIDHEKIDWEALFSQLSKKEKELFLRRFYYFQTIEEIAAENGKTYRSIESRLYRLKKKIKVILEREEKRYDES